MTTALLLIGAGLLVSVAVDRVDVSPLVRAVRRHLNDARLARQVAAPVRDRLNRMDTTTGRVRPEN